MKHQNREAGTRQWIKRWGLPVAWILGSVLYEGSGPRTMGVSHGILRAGSEQTAAMQARAEREELSEDPNSEVAEMDPVGRIDQLPVATHLGEWVNRGPKNYGGKVHDVAIDPTD